MGKRPKASDMMGHIWVVPCPSQAGKILFHFFLEGMMNTLPETNIAPETRPSQKGN